MTSGSRYIELREAEPWLSEVRFCSLPAALRAFCHFESDRGVPFGCATWGACRTRGPVYLGASRIISVVVAIARYSDTAHV